MCMLLRNKSFRSEIVCIIKFNIVFISFTTTEFPFKLGCTNTVLVASVISSNLNTS